MSNRLNFTEDDAWAVLFLATFPAAFPTRAMDICAAACSAAGDRPLSAAVALREIGVIANHVQADYFHGDVPCTRLLSASEVHEDYEGLTGHLIVETLRDTPPLTMPGILVANHGPFSWGKDAHDAVHNAVVLEEVARMAWITHQLNPQAAALPDYMLENHYQRKHGKNAYYGQSTTK